MQIPEQNSKKAKRVNIGLSGDLHAQAKIIAILKQCPLSKYLEACIEKGMKSDQKIIESLRIGENKKQQPSKEQDDEP